MKLSPLNQRRWRNFRRNRRAFWSLILFGVMFTLTLFAEFIANDKPILVRYDGGFYTPIFRFYPETEFGGDFRTEAVYADIEVQCLIVSQGQEACFDDPQGVMDDAADVSWMAHVAIGPTAHHGVPTLPLNAHRTREKIVHGHRPTGQRDTERHQGQRASLYERREPAGPPAAPVEAGDQVGTQGQEQRGENG